MVVYLPVDSKHHTSVGVIQPLITRLGVDNTQSLVSKNSRAAAEYTAPVGPAMSDFFAHAEDFLPELRRLLLYVEYSYYATHNKISRLG